MKDKVIELEDGRKLLVVDTIEQSNRTFLFVTEVIPDTEDVTGDFDIFEAVNNNIALEIVKVEDENIYELLMEQFLNRIED